MKDAENNRGRERWDVERGKRRLEDVENNERKEESDGRKEIKEG